MSKELSTDIQEELKSLFSKGDFSSAVEVLNTLHPVDVAEMIKELEIEDQFQIYEALEDEIKSDVVSHLDEDEREELLALLSAEEIANEVVDNMDSDDAADLIAELSTEKKEEVIKSISDHEHASDIIDLLSYPESTAGALMAKELIKVNVDWTVEECIIELRKQAEEVEQIHTVYAVDNHDKLIGRITLKNLLLKAPQAKAAEIVKTDIQSVMALDTDQEVVHIMEKYDLVVVPVVDELDRLLGRITIDDVVDVMKEEAEKDYQMASGISENVEHSDGILQVTKARFPWLLIGLAGGILGAKVIGLFDVVEQSPVLAAFIPLIAAMGGNVGVQSSAIVVQSIANQSFKGSVWSKLGKELSVGLLNGVLCSAILFAFNMVFSEDPTISLAVSISLLSVIVFAAVFGTWVPIILNKYKIDPALATGPFITTSNDVIGLFLYFTISSMLI